VIEYDLTANNRAGLNDKLDRLDLTATIWHVSVKPKKSKRSLQQNKWARKFATEFGKRFGYDHDDAYDLLMFKCNPVFITDPETGNEIRLAGHFSQKQDGTPRNTAEAAEVQEVMLRFGDSLGFYFDDRGY